ncbi:MAG: hypothetical protein V1682_04350 [Candidatus Omnitrophota bacterium]
MVFGKAGEMDVMSSFLRAQFKAQPLPTKPPEIFTIFNGVFCMVKPGKKLGPNMFIISRSSIPARLLNSDLRYLEKVSPKEKGLLLTAV